MSGKKFLMVCVMIGLLPILAFSQTTFTLEVEETEATIETAELYAFHCVLTNSTDSEQTYEFLKYDDDLPEGWQGTMCTMDGCFPAFVDSTTITMGAGVVDDLVSMDIVATTDGTGSMIIVIRNLNQQDDSVSTEFTLHVGESSVDEENLNPNSFSLAPVYPNPFNSTARISYSLPVAGQANIAVFDMQGREVQSLVNGFVNAGRQEIIWHADEIVASGTYFIRLQADGRSMMTRATLLR